MRILLAILLFVPSLLFAEDGEIDTFLVHKEKVIGEALSKLRGAEDDGTRELYNIELQSELEQILEDPRVLDYPFESWTTMSTITSPDGEFRIFNWNIEDENLNHSHYCYLVRRTRSNKPNYVYKFKENTVELPPRPTNTLTPDMWYGALYYKIIPVPRGNKTFYTVLGFSGEDRMTNQKLIDVFYFKGRTLRMGYPMFQEAKDSKRLVRRVFFQYSQRAMISLNMNEKLGGIVFDHLVPEQENLKGMYDFYIPDMTYDAYKWDGKIWRYEEDVIAYNNENKRIRQWHPTDGGDSSEYDEVRDFWINPVDPNSPVGGGADATAPVEDVRDSKDKRNGKKKSKKGRRKFKDLFKRKKKPRSAIGAD
ncbi:MAG: hypothetical protein HUJ25_00795 [Crocinitomicaceae bacterium]|nr:hypothetical protein [Crocinitomicaceae bacterium]